jgi:hypothetical protein
VKWKSSEAKLVLKITDNTTVRRYQIQHGKPHSKSGIVSQIQDQLLDLPQPV